MGERQFLLFIISRAIILFLEERNKKKILMFVSIFQLEEIFVELWQLVQKKLTNNSLESVTATGTVSTPL